MSSFLHGNFTLPRLLRMVILRDMARIILLIYLTMLCAAPAEDIVGWRIPLERYSARVADLPKLAKAPGPSPFFGPKDELYDLSKISHREFHSDTGWMVWNATSGTIVAKAGWDAIGRLHEVLGTPPHQCRVKVEILETAKGGAAPSASSKVMSSISVVGLAGKDFEASRETGGEKILLKGRTTWMNNWRGSLPELKMEVSYAPLGRPELFFATNLRMKSGESLWVARDAADGKALDIRVTVGIESTDGVPLEKWLMRQEGDRLVSVLPPPADLHDARKVAGRMLVAAPVVPGEWGKLPGVGDKPEDRFSPSNPFHEVIKPIPFQDIQPPAAIRGWIDHAVLDVRDYVGKTGLDLDSKDDFLGYDPIGKRMFLYTTSERTLLQYGGLFLMGLHASVPPQIALTTGDPAVLRMVSCSGLPASLQRKSADGAIIRSWESQLTAAEDSGVMQVELVSTDTAIKGGERRRIHASLKPGVLAAVSAEGAGPSDASLRLKVEIQEP